MLMTPWIPVPWPERRCLLTKRAGGWAVSTGCQRLISIAASGFPVLMGPLGLCHAAHWARQCRRHTLYGNPGPTFLGRHLRYHPPSVTELRRFHMISRKSMPIPLDIPFTPAAFTCTATPALQSPVLFSLGSLEALSERCLSRPADHIADPRRTPAVRKGKEKKKSPLSGSTANQTFLESPHALLLPTLLERPNIKVPMCARCTPLFPLSRCTDGKAVKRAPPSTRVPSPARLPWPIAPPP
ncbi:hypothetical protein CALCODRAFT_246634 [Calocera cornea HHB12733]|uniref:Uncharacterized protein n=1 Tax=Calocera cornea HHB12733 TaxID=1353952 RepID=A0A165JV12_9BASI|nr:hypothetical protein CALCODRAFT_246634 [Calocera cornea HHB12733]